MYFDWTVDVHGNGVDVVLISPIGAHLLVVTKLGFPCPNNILEYDGCITSLKAAIDIRNKDLEVYGDSILIIS